MTAPRSVGALASEAAEAIRALNHATFPGTESTPGGLTYPADAYDILASLSLLAARLPQLLGQLDRFVSREVDAGRVVVDGGEYVGDPQAAAAVTSHWLDQARIVADRLHHTLDRAQQAAAHLAAAEAEDSPEAS